MAREIPEVVRAAAGLAATVLDEARKLPETLPGLPVRVIGLAMQHAMKVQQQYAGFVARGDELFTGLRGEDEPGLATFDDDEPDTAGGYRESAFDRVADAPATEQILDELAIDEMVGDAPAAAPDTDASVTEDAAAVESALLESDAAPATDTAAPEPLADVATTADVLTPDGEVATVDATVTDEGVAAPEAAAPEAAAPETPAPEAPAPEAPAASAPATAPIEGYDDFSVAQLRGRLRGYALTTVAELVEYEQATRSREPYLRMLRNRLQKLEEQAVESSPLAPRGA